MSWLQKQFIGTFQLGNSIVLPTISNFLKFPSITDDLKADYTK